MFLREVRFVKLLSGTLAGLLRLGPYARGMVSNWGLLHER